MANSTRGLQEWEIPGADPQAQSLALGSDGAIWFTKPEEDMIGRMSPTGEFSSFPVLTPNGQPMGIVAGPDGALWFTEYAGEVGRITTGGIVTEYPVQGDAGQITVGPDGALWFTVYTDIGRITTSGQMSIFPLGTSNVPFDITSGPDGALWFSDAEATAFGAVGEITTQGTVTLFTMPGGPQDLLPKGIVAGPDKSLWVGTQNGMWRMRVDGRFKRFHPLGEEGYAVARGADGDVWFQTTGGIGRLDGRGVFSLTPLPSDQYVYGFAAGADHDLWFVAESSDKTWSIGRIRS